MGSIFFACGFIHDHESFLILLEIPFQTVDDTVLFYPHSAAVDGLVLPWLIFAVKVRAGCTSASTLQSEEHAADEGVQGGFSGLVFAVNHVQILVKGDGEVMEFAESVNM